jgi:hypothetical protein
MKSFATLSSLILPALLLAPLPSLSLAVHDRATAPKSYKLVKKYQGPTFFE